LYPRGDPGIAPDRPRASPADLDRTRRSWSEHPRKRPVACSSQPATVIFRIWRYASFSMRATEAQDMIAGLAWETDERGCWNWPNAVNRSGQPILSVDGEIWLAHRFTYQVWRARWHRLAGVLRPHVPLVPGCGSRRCVNPFHMFPVDAERGIGPPSPRGDLNRHRTHCPRGHPYAGANLHTRPCGRRRCRKCHREHARRYRRAQLQACVSAAAPQGAGCMY